MTTSEDISSARQPNNQLRAQLNNKKTRAPTGQQHHHHHHHQVRRSNCRHQTSSQQLNRSATAIDLHVRETASFWPNHRRQYSSSQAQLQSLTGDCSEFPVSTISMYDGRKTTPRQQTVSFLGRKQQQQLSTSQATLAAATTKPMMTSVPDDVQPQPTSLAMFANTRQHRTLPLVGAHRHHHQVAATPNHRCHNVPPIGSPLPPPYSVDPVPATSLPSTSAVYQQQQQQQHVICERPPPVQVQPAAEASQQLQQTTSHLPGQHPNNMLPAGNRNDPNNSNSNNILQQQSSTTSAAVHNQHQQWVLNFLNANNPTRQQQQNASNFPSLFSSQAHLYSLNSHHHLHHHHPHDPTAATATNLLNTCFQQQQHHHHQALSSSSSGISKSRSCFTCADISIKWYIAVIALLGLICALIGTIVGAVHSAGRDYISLALLLIGVGLVLVAISWIALRITVKTYKSSSAGASSSSPASGGRISSSSQQQQQQLNSVARLLAQAQGNQRATLLNERHLYMVAAAAAAAAALQSQAGGRGAANAPNSGGGRSTSPTDSQPALPAAQDASDSNSNSLLRGIKRRLPRRFARLIPEQRTELSSSRNSGQDVATQQQQQQQPPHNNSRTALAAAAALLHQYQHQQQHLVAPGAAHPVSCGLGATRSSGSSGGGGANAANANAAAAAAAATAAFAFLYPPAGLQPAHLAHLYPAFPNGAGEFPFRPPPPSYNAAMQDQRLRMLLQERIGLQAAQMSAMFPSAQLPPPPPPPSSATGVVRQHSSGNSTATATATAAEPTTTATPTSSSSSSATASESDSMRVTLPEQRPQHSGELRPSASSPNLSAGLCEPTLTSNDIYVSSSPPPPVQSPELRPSSSSSVVVNIVGSSSSQATLWSRDQSEGRRSRAEAKILGYL